MSSAKSIIYLAIALGTEPRCRPDIDKIYDGDRRRFISLLISSTEEVDHIFNRYTASTSSYIRKAFGIILYDEFGGDGLLIQRLIKKGFKPAYTYFTHRNRLALEDFTVWYNDKKGGLEHISGVYLDHCFLVMFYLQDKHGKHISRTPLYKQVSNQYSTILNYTSLLGIERFIDNPAKIRGYDDFLERLKYNGQIGDDVTLIFENLRLIEEAQVILTDEVDADNIREYIARMPFSKITNVLMLLMEIFGMDASVMREAKINQEEIVALSKYIHLLKNTNSLTSRERDIIFLVALVIFGLIREYQSLRDDHYARVQSDLENRELEVAREISETERKLREELEAVKSDLKTTKAKISTLTTSNQLKDNEIAGLSSEQRRLSLELSKAKENEVELQFLREFYFDSENDTVHSTEIEIAPQTLSTALEDLRRINGVIVGGHPRLQIKLKEALPSFILISEDDLGRDLSFIRNRDAVFLVSVHNNHGLYYKVMTALKNSDLTLSYLSKSQSVDRLVSEIYGVCSRKGLLNPVR